MRGSRSAITPGDTREDARVLQPGELFNPPGIEARLLGRVASDIGCPLLGKPGDTPCREQEEVVGLLKLDQILPNASQSICCLRG
eukprot:scaffold3424_cov256-Pinguiococcus_pyrenoidosus.AAC.3